MAGRKSKYETNVEPNLTLISAWCRDGANDKDIAKRLHISQETFYVYKREHPEFSESLKKGKEVIDTEVENALLKRALGYSYEETTKEVINANGLQTKKMKTVTKEVPPDVGAQFIWLKNRMPKKWRQEPNNNLTQDEEEDGLFDAIKKAVDNV